MPSASSTNSNKPQPHQNPDLDGILDDVSSDSQINHVRGALDDLDDLIEAAADVCLPELGKATGEGKGMFEEGAKEC